MAVAVYPRLSELLRARNLSVAELERQIKRRFGLSVDPKTLYRLTYAEPVQRADLEIAGAAAAVLGVGLDDLFEVRVDGNTVREHHLAGKPAPDTFLMAAKLLGADPTRSVVVEDAISGVQAGRQGNFGCVIGVARRGNAEELRRNGAHLVVHDLGELVH